MSFRNHSKYVHSSRVVHVRVEKPTTKISKFSELMAFHWSIREYSFSSTCCFDDFGPTLLDHLRKYFHVQ